MAKKRKKTVKAYKTRKSTARKRRKTTPKKDLFCGIL